MSNPVVRVVVFSPRHSIVRSDPVVRAAVFLSWHSFVLARDVFVLSGSPKAGHEAPPMLTQGIHGIPKMF